MKTSKKQLTEIKDLRIRIPPPSGLESGFQQVNTKFSHPSYFTSNCGDCACTLPASLTGSWWDSRTNAVISITGSAKASSFTSTAQKVLTEKVLYGQTISYKNLAALCGNEKACRAVGMAMRNNPISFIVPCHRVITHSGHLGNYSGGHKNKIKQWLLTHENAIP
ncbi:MGMT [Mytilus edulis]|uniref:Methylated-DNA--protein-cysteine methyltransferase n=1 Tax=Mytilus edulis TaxID=6550 RepID=A0A8S3UFQ9_MYTED|nr:MGMT [Mytilus edulis]